MLGALIKSLRPHQWVKNLFVVAPLLFSKNLGDMQRVALSAAGFALFSLLSGSVYLVNDLFDIEKDRAHPLKKNRPIPSGRLPLNAARSAAALLMLVALSVSFAINLPFFACAAAYLLVNLTYSLALKQVPFIDVFSIASGFLLRVYAGAMVIGVHASPWLLTCTFALACFLGFGKRAHELTAADDLAHAKEQRPVLARYRRGHLMGILWFLAAATCVAYGLYTVSAHTRQFFGTDRLLYTTPFAAFGVIRFLLLAARKTTADSPTDAMLRDIPFMANLIGWAVAMVLVIYVLP